MTLNRRALMIAGLAAAAPTLALADAPKLLPAKKIFPFLDLYLSIPAAERSRFSMAYYLRHDGKPATGANMTLIGAGGARIALPIGPDGRFQRTPTQAELKANAMIEVAPHGDGKFQLAMELQPNVRLAEVMTAADFAAAIDQCAAAIKKNAGILGFAAPKITQVLFVGAGSGSAVMVNGAAAALPLVKTLPAYAPATIKGAAQLKFSKAPSRALLA